jgi:hypothetical protein
MSKSYAGALRHYTLAGTWRHNELTLFLITQPAHPGSP